MKAGTKFQRITEDLKTGDDFQEVITITEVDPEDPTEGHIIIESGFVGLQLHVRHDFWTTLTSSAFARTIRDFEEVD